MPVSLWTAESDEPHARPRTCSTANSQPIGANGSYTLALPSLNFAYWVIRNQLQARLAVAADHGSAEPEPARADVDQQRQNGTPSLFYNGTAGLKPIRANQADLSLEWYYSPHSALHGGVFAKKIKDDIYEAVSDQRRPRHDQVRSAGHRVPFPACRSCGRSRRPRTARRALTRAWS